MTNSPNSLHFSIPPDQRKQKLCEVQQTSTFLWFIEHASVEQYKLLFAEIDNILDNGMPAIEYMQTGMTDAEVGITEYRKIATLCFFETLMGFVEENCERTRDLRRNPAFNEAYEAAMNEIILYLEGKRSDFPRDAVRCLFLLTDEYIDQHRQGITATRLTLHSFTFCKTDEQKEEIERLIKECKL